MPETGRLLWFEYLDSPLTSRHGAGLMAQIGIHDLALDDPDEWILGYRIVGAPRIETASLLYLTRRLHSSGVRFDMRTMAEEPPDTTELHELVKKYIREFPVVAETKPQQAETLRSRQRWYGAGSALVDCKAQLVKQRSRDLALARARITERLHFDVPALTDAGLHGYAQVDLSFPPAGDLVDITVGVGTGGSPDRLRLRVALGESTVTVRFSSIGIAVVKGLEADPSSDLLHITFELRP
jgi:hypothetical protein